MLNFKEVPQAQVCALPAASTATGENASRLLPGKIFRIGGETATMEAKFSRKGALAVRTA